MTSRRSLTLRRAIVLTVVLGLLVPVLLISGYSWYWQYTQGIERQTGEMLRQNADILANGMQEPLWHINDESANALVEAMMLRNEDIVRIEVHDEALGLFVSAQRHLEPGRHSVAMQQPVTYRGSTLGSIKVEVSSDRLRREMTQELLGSIAAVLAQAVLSIALILILLEKRLVRPLTNLGQSAKRLASRELETPISWQHLDEIGMLGKRLEETRLSLHRLFAELDRKNEELKQDIDKRKRIEQALHERQERYRVLVERSPIAIVEWDPEMRVAEWNDAAERIFGHAREQAIGQHAGFIAVGSGADSMQARLARWLHDGMDGRHVVENRHADGRVISCQWNHARIPGEDHRPDRILSIAEDITEKRRAEREILELNASLEHRVAARTKELQQTNRDLAATLESLRVAQEELVRNEKLAALGSLVAGIAHELNTPIGNGLMVATTLVEQARQLARRYEANDLKRSVLEAHIQDAQTAGDILVRNLQRAADMVSSFKQVAADQTSSQRRSFSVAELVAEIMLTLWPTVKKSNVIIRQQIPASLRMDSYPGPLGQVLANLVNNALLHAFEGRAAGHVEISASANDGWIELIVKDDGAGIAPSDQNRIFDPFFTTRLGTGGSGLGLHISHNIVTGVLGGRIAVRSARGSGTAFVLNLPMLAPLLSSGDHSAASVAGEMQKAG